MHVSIVGLGYLQIYAFSTRLDVVDACFTLDRTIIHHLVMVFIIFNYFSVKGSP